MNLDISSILEMGGIVVGAIVVIFLIIYVIIVIRRKTNVKQVTDSGTDKSDFAKKLMDEYHQERRNQE